MKIAFCLAGDPRDFDYIWSDFLSKVKPSGWEVDFYVHNWIREPIGEPGGEMENSGAGIRAQVSSFDYLKVVRPVRAVLDVYEASQVYRDFGNSIDPLRCRSYSMFYGIQQAFQVVQEPGRYDLIIRCRPDVFFERALDFGAMVSALSEGSGYAAVFLDLFVNPGAQPSQPTNGWGSWSPEGAFIQDFFWAFCPSLLPHFCRIYEEMTLFCADFDGSDIHSEVPGRWIYIQEFFLRKWLRYKGIRPIKFGEKMLLARHHKALFEGRAFV
jgi:citrate lyase gamma subunit